MDLLTPLASTFDYHWLGGTDSATEAQFTWPAGVDAELVTNN